MAIVEVAVELEGVRVAKVRLAVVAVVVVVVIVLEKDVIVVVRRPSGRIVSVAVVVAVGLSVAAGGY